MYGKFKKFIKLCFFLFFQAGDFKLLGNILNIDLNILNVEFLKDLTNFKQTKKIFDK